jgi:hypothetical protein
MFYTTGMILRFGAWDTGTKWRYGVNILCTVMWNVPYVVTWNVMCTVIWSALRTVMWNVLYVVTWNVMCTVIWSALCAVMWNVPYVVTWNVVCTVIWSALCTVIQSVLYTVMLRNYTSHCCHIFGCWNPKKKFDSHYFNLPPHPPPRPPKNTGALETAVDVVCF